MTRDAGDVCSVDVRTPGWLLRGRAEAGDTGYLLRRRADVWDVCAADARTSGVSVPSARGPSGMSDMAPSIRAPL